MALKAKLQPQKIQSFSSSGRAHHPISSAPLPRATKPLMSQKVQKIPQSPIPTLLAQQETRYKDLSMVFRQPSSTQGKLSSSSGAIPNQWSSIEDLLPDRLSDSSQIAHVSNSNKGGLNIQNLATGLNNSNHRQLRSSQPQPSSQALNASSASAQQLKPTELETLAQEVYHRLRQRLELDRERHGFQSSRLPW